MALCALEEWDPYLADISIYPHELLSGNMSICPLNAV